MLSPFQFGISPCLLWPHTDAGATAEDPTGLAKSTCQDSTASMSLTNTTSSGAWGKEQYSPIVSSTVNEGLATCRRKGRKKGKVIPVLSLAFIRSNYLSKDPNKQFLKYPFTQEQ